VKYFSKYRKLTLIVEDVLRQGKLSEEAAIQAVEDSMVAAGFLKNQVWKYIEKLAVPRATKNKGREQGARIPGGVMKKRRLS
jgi:hypothetical protein